MFFLSKDSDNIPAMSWLKLWKGILLRFGRAINSISRFSLLESLITRQMVDPSVIIHANGVRVENIDVEFEAGQAGGVSGFSNSYNIHQANIRVTERASGDLLVDTSTQRISSLIISYKLEINNRAEGLRNTQSAYSATLSIDGIEASMANSFNNYRYDYVTEDREEHRKLTLCGTAIVDVLAGEHMVSIKTQLAGRSLLDLVEVNISRFNW